MNAELLLKILDIIEYHDNREEIVKDFQRIVFFKIINELSQSLPHEERHQMHTYMQAAESQDDILIIFQKFFTDEEVDACSRKVFSKVVFDWLTEISPTLTKEQRDGLTDLFLSAKLQNRKA